MMNVGSNVQQTILEYEARLDALRWSIEEKERNLQEIMALHQSARTRQKELIADQGKLIELLRLVFEGDAEELSQSDVFAGMQHAFTSPDANGAPAQDKIPQCKWFDSGAPGVQSGGLFAQAAGLSGLALPSYLSTAAARQNLRASQTATSVLDQDLWEPARPGTIQLGQPPFQVSSVSGSFSPTLDTQAAGLFGPHRL
jgi:hypothetical protein